MYSVPDSPSYHPTINPSSRELERRTGPRTDRNLALYKLSEKRKEAQKDRLAEIEDRELQECTFAPKIHKPKTPTKFLECTTALALLIVFCCAR